MNHAPKKRDEPARPIDRSAFLYMDHAGEKEDFAQCRSCRLWAGEDRQRCLIHSPTLRVGGDATCGLYVHGTPITNGNIVTAVSQEESGFEKREVRCENCVFFDAVASRCNLFDTLNCALPTLFSLDAKVDKHGCCNANTPRS